MQKSKYIFFYQKFVHLGENTSKYCSRIIVIHVHATVFSKVHSMCHNIAIGIKPGSESKKTDKHAVDCLKVRKTHTTITRHQEGKLSKSTYPLFPFKMIANLKGK